MSYNFNLSEGLLEELTDFSKIGFLRINKNSEILFINRYASNMLRILEISGKYKYAGTKLTDLLPHLSEFVSILTKAVTLSDFEMEIKGGDGAVSTIIFDAYCGKDEHQNDIYNIIVKDITDYKKIQREFIETRNRLKSIINSIPDVIYSADPEGKITFISDSIFQYGYSADELIGKSILDIIHPDDRERARYRIVERRRGERRTSEFEIRILTKNSGPVMFEVKDKLLEGEKFFSLSSEGIYTEAESRNPEFLGTQGVARDITPRIFKNLEFDECMEKYNAIVESLDDGYYETDLYWNFTNVNNSLCNIFGLERGDIIGKNISDVIITGESAKFEEVKNGKINIDVNSRLFEWVISRNNGRKRYVDVSISQAKNIHGEKSGYRGIIRDVTEKHRIEDELLRARKLEAIGILAGGIAHDYNNVLTAIIGNISLAKMAAESDNHHLLEILGDAEEASLKAKVLTQRLSVFGKGGRPQKKIVPVSRFIEDTVDLFVQQYALRINVEIKGTLFEVNMDEIQIAQVLENIFKNAMEAMNGAGQISLLAENISVETEQAHHELTLQPGDYVKIDITDQGSGIISNDIYRVFDPYYTTKEMASGMGLATSYAIIKRHNGYIDVKSEFGKGSTFMIYLPAEIKI